MIQNKHEGGKVVDGAISSKNLFLTKSNWTDKIKTTENNISQLRDIKLERTSQGKIFPREEKSKPYSSRYFDDDVHY